MTQLQWMSEILYQKVHDIAKERTSIDIRVVTNDYTLRFMRFIDVTAAQVSLITFVWFEANCNPITNDCRAIAYELNSVGA